VSSTRQQRALRISRHIRCCILRQYINILLKRERAQETRIQNPNATITVLSVSRPRQMQMALGRSRIPRLYSRQRQSQNKPGKDQSRQRIAYANYSQRSTSLY
jgi:hypothetical protein